MGRADPAPTDASCALWDFALAAYARPGVSARCLALQDRHGAVVMVLLALCSLAARGVDAQHVDIPRIAARADLLERHLIAPLRAARRFLSGAARALPECGVSDVAEGLLASELSQEQLQARLLSRSEALSTDCLAGDAGAAVRATALLAAYFRHLGMDGLSSREAARSLAAAVFPDAPSVGARV